MKGVLSLLIEDLLEHNGRVSQHMLVIGPKGSGKTALLSQVVAEAGSDADLSNMFLPVMMDGESRVFANADQFWLEALCGLGTQSSDLNGSGKLIQRFNELQDMGEDTSMLGLRCLAAVIDFLSTHDKCMLLLVDNLDRLFNGMVDHDSEWVLRKTFQTEPRILMLASASSRFDAIDQYDRALYGFLRIRNLEPAIIPGSVGLQRVESRQQT